MAAGINKTMYSPPDNPVKNDDYEIDVQDESFYSITSNPFDSLPSFLTNMETTVDDSFIIVKNPLFTRQIKISTILQARFFEQNLRL
jgi:hypothetical protein